MQARHLLSGHNLNVVNPSEIVLQRIIGEGSFGRVWSGMWRSSQVAVKEFVFAQVRGSAACAVISTALSAAPSILQRLMVACV
jgi:hypothetical protein